MSTWQPFSIETEQELLGCILINNAAFEVVQGIVEAGHFFEILHQQLFEIIAALIKAGKTASPVTVKTFLPSDHDIGGKTVSQYLALLAANATTILNARDFAMTIRDLADRRLIAEVAKSLDPKNAVDAAELAAWGVEQLDGIVAQRSHNGAPAVTMKQAVVRAVDATAHAYQNDGKLTGLPYGLSELDHKTLGAQRGELIVIAGRAGMGKTAIGLGVTRNLGKSGFKGMFVSLEMGDVALTQRMLSDEMYDTGKLSYWQIRSGRYHEREFQWLTDAADRLAELPIKIEQQPQLTVSQIGARARQMKRRGGLDFMTVDHLGLVRASDRYAGNKVNETGETTGALKAIAKELDIPVFLLAQVNRGVESRDDKRPGLSDLRSSGDIEQDADTVMFLYREAYYLGLKEPRAGTPEFDIWTMKMEECWDTLEVIVAKQRSGPVGTVKLKCDIAHNAIRNLHQDDGLPAMSGDFA